VIWSLRHLAMSMTVFTVGAAPVAVASFSRARMASNFSTALRGWRRRS
jgi:hypothetical protein